MRSEWEDAPEHLRSRKKDSPWRLVAILSIGSAILLGLAALIAEPIALDINQINSGTNVTGKTWFNQEQAEPAQPVSEPSLAQYDAPEPSAAPEPKGQRPLTQAEIEWFEEASARTIERKQTSFSDENYTPRPVANTMQPPPARYYASSSSSNTQKRSETRETNMSNWSWENGHNKQRVGGQFQWTVVNDQIDFSSVCQNYKRGSLIYRDCRKGAKVAFKQMCGRYKPACSAENNFLP
ncbi:hypothetical protein CH92_05675 [Stutzerimonas stutzeri]|uniref:Uncharacterized protein n=1 Tax=Stutzerimonas stutzeri TaxID=316 RepID=W8RRG1_STUST|nr:hypothetical protein [Stutzerimonas stutzeri]AHL74611.1 hypothetical protein CH92_05675 [Stutzerimonas stutzeri]MCQ4329141.1 hypothetical protein [Stutzerimonas stutzeri]